MPESTSPSCLAANLSCETHPVFARKHWFGIDDGEYEQLKPALQLTTMLMSTPGSLSFFAILLFGDRAIEETVSEDGKKKLYGRITEKVHLTPFKAERVRDMFCELEGIIKFTCQTIDGTETAYAQTDEWSDLTDAEKFDLQWRHDFEKPAAWSARMSLKHNMTIDRIEGEEKEFCWPEPQGPTYNPYEDEGRKPLQDPRARLTPTTIALSTPRLLHLRARHQSTENILQSNLVVAMLLIHELAHAVEFGRPECREWDVDEAMFPDEDTPELGRQAEMHVVGGLIFEDECCFGDWLHFNQTIETWKQAYCVPLDFVARIQQQEFWDSFPFTDFTGTELLYLPKTQPVECISSPW